jgi:light-regulated signal transduction histidine kinase (bacteriophytochrome)
LGTLAEVILAELRVQAPDRAVIWSIEPDLNVLADPALINILLGNLLRNAWKFTGEQLKAHIEFFATDVDGEKRFCIRDNGAGFDMAYADKLFKPFHRLHDTGRFEGAGIGLTIAQRIVQRHRGRIWAEAEPGRGASLYFTLP